MANVEHIDLLKGGRDVWNVWRGENPNIIPDLSEAELDGYDLQYYDFEQCWLVHASMIGANLSFANFRNADLRDVNLENAILDKANFDMAIISILENDSLVKIPETIPTNISADEAIVIAVPEYEPEAQVFHSITNENGEVIISLDSELQYVVPIRQHTMHSFTKGKLDIKRHVRLGSLHQGITPLESMQITIPEFDAKHTQRDANTELTPDKIGTLVDFSNQSDNCVPVFYATNREPVHYKNGSVLGYSSERSNNIHYGVCNVYIPGDHKMGKTKKTFLQKILNLFSDNKDIKVQSIVSWSEKEFYDTFKSEYENDDEVLVYIHGYNVDFNEAAVRAAQFGVDLSIKKPVAFYSWPSKGQIKKYNADEATIQASEHYLERFLVQIVDVVNTKNVYVVAHSMGNRGLLNALKNIETKQKSNFKLKHIVFAAPDVDKDVFERDSASCGYCSENTTLYVSDKDKAVSFSGYLHDYDRAGYVEPVTICNGIQTIKVSKIDVGILGHGYYAEARPVLTDIGDALRSHENRMQITPSSDDRNYWEIKA